MGHYIYAIYVASQDARLAAKAENQWPFATVKPVNEPFKGIAIIGHDTAHYSDEVDWDTKELDNECFIADLPEFSKEFPDLNFVVMEEWDHGNCSSNQGIVFCNGKILLNELGDEGTMLEKHSAALDAGTTNYFKIFDDIVRCLTAYLGVELDKNAHFAPFDDDYFE